MDWRDYSLARTYIAEKYVGSRVREAQRIEEAQAKAARKSLGGRR